MTFEIRQISLTADGREIIRSVTVAKPEISLGRAAENDVHLPDLAVEPDHARIEQGDGRHIRVHSLSTLGFTLDGRVVQDADVDSATGAELRFGGHRITVSLGADRAVVLTVQRAQAISEASQEVDEAQAFSLASLMPTKRVMAWGLGVLVLLAFLAVPVFSYLTRTTEDSRNIYAVMKENGTAHDGVLGDAAWSSGPLSRAHHTLEGKCEACHVNAFVSVRDAACKTCHTDVHDHAPPARIADARAAPGVGGAILAGFASAFGKPAEGACADCHREHEGAGPMQPTAQVFCTDCHASLSSRLKDTSLGDVGDFGASHPQFRPAVVAAAGAHPRFVRTSLDARPVDNGGLKFPHDMHLSTTNGVARMAQRLAGDYGFGNALECKNCHTPTSDGVRFKPVDMETNCQMCHSLSFENIGGTMRTLRHGEPDQVVADLRAYYRSTAPAAPIELGGMARRRPGGYAAGRVYHAYFGAAAARPANAERAIAAVFSRGGACYDCHTITPPGVNGAAGWRVLPVVQPARYMQKGWFDHGAHKTEKCTTCHNAAASKAASDLMLPGIKTCRECHGGEKSHSDVPSSCALCHSYHADEGAPWKSALASEGRTARRDEARTNAP